VVSATLLVNENILSLLDSIAMFPPDVKEKAMVACGRRCCLCRKYCGVGMECHHITPEAVGGSGSYDNCIPLCFDCHAEVGHYTNSHPKGIKFSPNELQGHRDRWYKMIQTGLADSAPRDHVGMDRKMFVRIARILGGSKAMLHFKTHEYGGPYRVEREEGVREFWHFFDLPECQFFDLCMEAALSDLKAAVNHYHNVRVNRVWNESHGIAAVPQEWRYQNPERFDEARQVMNQASQKVWEAYCRLVSEGRRTLQIDPLEVQE
jgi:hypothetical protein